MSRAVRAPSGMDPAARRFWRKVVPALEEAGLLHPVDGPALELLAVSYAAWERAAAELRDTTDPKRAAVLSSALCDLAGVWLELARDFGLTPRSRRELANIGEGERLAARQLGAFLWARGS